MEAATSSYQSIASRNGAGDVEAATLHQNGTVTGPKTTEVVLDSKDRVKIKVRGEWKIPNVWLLQEELPAALIHNATFLNVLSSRNHLPSTAFLISIGCWCSTAWECYNTELQTYGCEWFLSLEKNLPNIVSDLVEVNLEKLMFDLVLSKIQWDSATSSWLNPFDILGIECIYRPNCWCV